MEQIISRQTFMNNARFSYPKKIHGRFYKDLIINRKNISKSKRSEKETQLATTTFCRNKRHRSIQV